jgi:N-acyl-D-aspartate/D-glutamate deacylase
MPYDLIIRNGMVVDGSGFPRYHADVAVADGRIAEIGTLEDAIRRSTFQPARIMGLSDRGLVREGMVTGRVLRAPRRP